MQAVQDQKSKMKAARLSLISNALLTSLKLGVGIIMGSMSVISEAAHSGLDLLASLIAFAAIRQAGRPADEGHRFGHGKFENLAALAEAFLILGAAGAIVYHAWERLWQPVVVVQLDLGLVVMAFSALVNHVISRYLLKVAESTCSPALAADGWHLRTDVYSSLGVLAGILAIKVTGYYWIDAVIALVVALLIVKAAWELSRESLGGILDARLSDEEEHAIRRVLEGFAGQYVEFYRMRTRRAGSERHVDFHLVVPRGQSVAEAHALCDKIEEEVRRNLPGVQILIHTEPCRPGLQDCTNCRVRVSFSSPAQKPCHEANCSQCLTRGDVQGSDFSGNN